MVTAVRLAPRYSVSVVHAGVYSEPGSLKARFCRNGATATYAYCRENGLPFRQIGKLVVATDERETRGLQHLFQPSGRLPDRRGRLLDVEAVLVMTEINSNEGVTT